MLHMRSLQKEHNAPKAWNNTDACPTLRHRVVYLSHAENGDRPLPRRLPGVTQTGSASQSRLGEPAAPPRGHPCPTPSPASYSRQPFTALGAAATAARETAIPLFSSSRARSAQPPALACPAA